MFEDKLVWLIYGNCTNVETLLGLAMFDIYSEIVVAVPTLVGRGGGNVMEMSPDIAKLFF